jgi:hypothetical protein
VIDFNAWEQTVLSNLQNVMTFFWTNLNEFHCLLFDFQVLIDTQGEFHFLDLNCCFDSNGTLRLHTRQSITIRAFKKLKELPQRIMKHLKEQQQQQQQTTTVL